MGIAKSHNAEGFCFFKYRRWSVFFKQSFNQKCFSDNLRISSWISLKARRQVWCQSKKKNSCFWTYIDWIQWNAWPVPKNSRIFSSCCIDDIWQKMFWVYSVEYMSILNECALFVYVSWWCNCSFRSSTDWPFS